MSSERGAFRGLFYLGGVVATVAGAHTALSGARSVAGRREPADAALESELRFYGTFYCAYGLTILRSAGAADRRPEVVRAIAGSLFLAGLARAGGWRAAGRPEPLQRVLLAIELGAPPAVLAWHSRLRRV